MIRRLVPVVAAACLLVPPAHAGEPQLAGIRLDQQAMELFKQEPYGPPEFFGPLGTTFTWGITATTPGGPAAPPGFGMAPPAAPAPAAPVGMRLPGQMESDEEELRAALARLQERPPTGPPGGAPGVAGFAQPTIAPAMQQQGGIALYWLYNFSGAQVVLGLDPGGLVQTILVAGKSWTGATTQHGVKLGDGYLSVLDKYGFPDSTEGAGGNLVLNYVDAALTLTLTDLRVTSIYLRKGASGPAAGAVIGR
jgi:hypothetical protein